MRTILGTIAGTFVVLAMITIGGLLIWITIAEEYGFVVSIGMIVIFLGWSIGSDWFRKE